MDKLEPCPCPFCKKEMRGQYLFNELCGYMCRNAGCPIDSIVIPPTMMPRKDAAAGRLIEAVKKYFPRAWEGTEEVECATECDPPSVRGDNPTEGYCRACPTRGIINAIRALQEAEGGSNE
jgi:hypothetical protein